MLVLRDHVTAKNFPRLAALAERAMKIEEGVDKTRRLSVSQVLRNAINRVALYSPPSCGGPRTLRPTHGGTERTV
jgi:N-acetyl-beta-hexosaminidase